VHLNIDDTTLSDVFATIVVLRGRIVAPSLMLSRSWFVLLVLDPPLPRLFDPGCPLKIPGGFPNFILFPPLEGVIEFLIVRGIHVFLIDFI
jgi:hypothetical protein